MGHSPFLIYFLFSSFLSLVPSHSLFPSYILFLSLTSCLSLPPFLSLSVLPQIKASLTTQSPSCSLGKWIAILSDRIPNFGNAVEITFERIPLNKGLINGVSLIPLLLPTIDVLLRIFVLCCRSLLTHWYNSCWADWPAQAGSNRKAGTLGLCPYKCAQA